MKLQIDTNLKTIKIEEAAKIVEILSVIKKLFPNDEWKKYTLEAVTVINNWGNPIYIPSVWDHTLFPKQWDITCTTSDQPTTACFEIQSN